MIEEALAAAFAHHRANRFAEAAVIYQEILHVQPGHADALHLFGVLQAQSGRFEDAVALLQKAVRQSPRRAAFSSDLGNALSALGRYDEARRVLERAVAMDPDAPHSIYHLALVVERLGDAKEAQPLFERAHSLDPAHYPLPAEMSDEVFDGSVQEALENLPRSIREYIDPVQVLIEDWPSRELVLGEKVSPQILGLFIGTPRTGTSAWHQPDDIDRVIIFKKNLEKICRTAEDLIDQVQITVRHEVGHYLGLDEDDMERLGLA